MKDQENKQEDEENHGGDIHPFRIKYSPTTSGAALIVEWHTRTMSNSLPSPHLTSKEGKKQGMWKIS